MEAWKWSLSIRVDSGTFTCIEGSAPRHAWGLGGWVADGPLRCYQTNAHDRKNGCNIYNARNCGISVVMKIFLLYFRYWEWLENFAIYKGCLLRTKENFSHVMIIKERFYSSLTISKFTRIVCYEKRILDPVMLKERFMNGLKTSNFLRICMEKHLTVTGWQELFFPYKSF